MGVVFRVVFRVVFILVVLCGIHAYLSSKPSIIRNHIIRRRVVLHSSILSEYSSNKNNINIYLDNENKCRALSNSIKKNDVIYSIPLGLCLDVTRSLNKFTPFGITLDKLKTRNVGLLALLLLHEKYLGNNSKYSNYLKTLPSVAPGILSWDNDLFDELVKSSTRNYQIQLNAVKYDYENLSKVSGKLFPNSIFNYEEWLWAVGIVKSRIVYIDDNAMLLPGMDSIEYDPLSEAEPTIASAGVFGGKEVRIVAERSYDKDETIVMSYGIKTSAECIEDHGIVPDITLDDSCCEIMMTIDGTEKYADDKLSILERNSIAKTQTYDLEADSSTGIDPSLLQFLRLKLIDGKDSFILESCFYNTVFFTLQQPFSKVNEIKVYEYIFKYCDEQLDKINSISSAKNDESIVSNKSNDINKIMIARLRLQERASLVENLNRAKTELTLLQGVGDSREYYQERRLRELDLLRPLDESEILE